MVVVDGNDDVSWETYTSTQQNADEVGDRAGAPSTTNIPIKATVMKRVPGKRKLLTKTEGADPNKPEPPAQKRRELLVKGKSEDAGPNEPDRGCWP